MPGQLDARALARRLVGRTLPTPTREQPNTILRVSGANVIVGTEESPEGEPVALTRVQRGLDLLFDKGEVRIAPETFGGYRPSSAISAIIATLNNVDVETNPTWIRLGGSTPLHDALHDACRLRPLERATPSVSAQDPLWAAITHQLRDQVTAVVSNGHRYFVQGSVGEMNTNWAETPWVCVFDRLVTETARRGHYVAYLIHPAGTGAVVCLMQSMTEMQQLRGPGFLNAMASRSAALASLLPDDARRPFQRGPFDLGARGHRSRGYQAGIIVGRWYSADAIPHDAALGEDLRQLLEAYDTLTEGIDREDAFEDPDAPPEAQTGIEARRYRWHLRAEGRNRTLARRAKEIQGFWCRVCGRDFGAELGDVGKRCIDAHHRVPFNELDGAPTRLDPATDFDIVCSNCHRLLHSETPPLTVERLRTSFRQGR